MQRELPSDAASVRSDANALITRGNALMRAGRVAAALGCYEAAVGLEPDRFEARANLGTALLAAGRHDAAKRHLRRALAARPAEAPLQLALARACAGLGQFGEAEAGYRAALAGMQDGTEALLELGTLLRQRGAFDEAMDCYRKALARDPSRASAHYGLGLCLRERGEVAAAIACFARAIAAQPDHIDAHYRLAVLTPDDPGGARRAQLEALLSRAPDLPGAQRIRYWFTLGRLREHAGDFDAAFAAYAEGNRLQWQKLGLARQYPAREVVQARFVERIRSTFNAALLEQPARVQRTDPGMPIFIVGMPRSGTSLIEQMLAAHPAVAAGGESRVLPDLLEETFGFEESTGAGAYPEIVPSLAPDRLRQLGTAYLERARERTPGAGRLTDKLTGNFLHAGMIHLMLPGAKIIHALRDPRDACFSCYANLFAGDNVAASYDLGAEGRHGARCLGLLRHWRAVLPGTVFSVVRYEDLVGDPPGTLRRLLEFLGLPWDGRCLEFHRQSRAVHTVSAGQVRRPVYTTSVSRWRNFERHLGPLLAALGNTIPASDGDATGGQGALPESTHRTM